MDALEALMNIAENVTMYGLEYVFDRYYSKYRGYCFDNADPLKKGRIIAVVPSLSGNKPLGQWALPAYGPAGAQSGFFHPPEKLDPVWIEFEMGDLTAPIYSGGWWGVQPERDPDMPTEFRNDPPTVRGYMCHNGCGFVVETKADEEQVRLQWHRPSDDKYSFISVDKHGSVQMQNHNGTMLQLNAVDGKEGITLIDKHGNLLASDKDGWKVVQADGTLLELKKDVATIMGKQVVISGEGLNVATGGATIGDGATEPLVLGNKLLALWTQAMAIFASHIHPTPAGPSGPPTGAPWPSYPANTNSLRNKSV